MEEGVDNYCMILRQAWRWGIRVRDVRDTVDCDPIIHSRACRLWAGPLPR